MTQHSPRSHSVTANIIRGCSLETYVADWRPDPVVEEDPLSPGPTAAFSALLDEKEPAAVAGEALPPLWHWFHFLSWPAQQDLGTDGHPTAGHFLPPLPERTRMFAGGRLTVHEPLLLGGRAERTSSLAAVTPKRGRTGELLFVTQRSEFRQRGALCLVEEQDLVYRSGPVGRPAVSPAQAEPSAVAEWTLPLETAPTLLFRFSALTANAHRIHYDQPYVTAEEGYPGLVVHGPLLALAMLELVRRNAPHRRVRSYAYRLHAPAFAHEPLRACGTPTPGGADLTIASAREDRHASAQVVFA